MKTITALRLGITLLGLSIGLMLACGGGATTKKPAELTIEQRVRTAHSMLRAGRVTQAMEIMDEVLAERSDDARLWSEYGSLCFQAGRYATAERAFLEAIRLDPNFSDAHNFLGVVYVMTDRLGDARKHLQTALDDPAYPTPEKVYLNMSRLLVKEGRDAEAVDALRRAVEINPKYFQAHYSLASILDRMGEFHEAVREYEVAAPDYRQVAEYHYRLGNAYLQIGEREKARESLRRVLSIAPGSHSAARADDLLEMLD